MVFFQRLNRHCCYYVGEKARKNNTCVLTAANRQFPVFFYRWQSRNLLLASGQQWLRRAYDCKNHRHPARGLENARERAAIAVFPLTRVRIRYPQHGQQRFLSCIMYSSHILHLPPPLPILFLDTPNWEHSPAHLLGFFLVVRCFAPSAATGDGITSHRPDMDLIGLSCRNCT